MVETFLLFKIIFAFHSFVHCETSRQKLVARLSSGMNETSSTSSLSYCEINETPHLSVFPTRCCITSRRVGRKQTRDKRTKKQQRLLLLAASREHYSSPTFAKQKQRHHGLGFACNCRDRCHHHHHPGCRAGNDVQTQKPYQLCPTLGETHVTSPRCGQAQATRLGTLGGDHRYGNRGQQQQQQQRLQNDAKRGRCLVVVDAK